MSKSALKDLRQNELKWEYLSDSNRQKSSLGSAKPAPGSSKENEKAKATDIAEPSSSEYQKADDSGKSMAVKTVTPSRREEASVLGSVLARQTETVIQNKYPRGLNRLRYLADGLVVVSKQPKRFKWAVQDGKKFNKKLARIQQRVRTLEEMLGHDQMTILVRGINEFKLHLLQLTTDVSQMRALWQSQYNQTPSLDGSTLVDGRPARHSALVSSDAAEARFTAFLNAAIAFSIEVNEPGTPGKLELSPSEVAASGVVGTSKNEKNRWVEWKRYDVDDAIKRTPSEDDVVRVKRLVSLLLAQKKPVEFCVPPCLGYFIDKPENRRFGLVFEPPENASSLPTSLLTSFKTRGISLATRMNIAQQLSQWLLYMHAVNWLHKGIRSDNVWFFHAGGPKDYRQAYISGFDYSRMSKGDPTTAGPSATDESWAWYIHPDYQGSRRGLGFRKTYDMYSLGIILIELAFWQPMPAIVEDSRKPKMESGAAIGPESTMTAIQKLRARLLSGEMDVLERVQELTGPKYYSATRACLEGMLSFGLAEENNQAEPAVGAHIQRAFVEQVVDCLQSIVV